MTDVTAASADVVLAEGVWAEPFEVLPSLYRVRREPAGASREEVLGGLRHARALVVRNTVTVDADLLDAAPHLEIVGRAGVGLDNIDVEAADARGVVISSPQGANAQSVAEMTLALALALARRLVELDRTTRSGRWERTAGLELSGGTWGVIGAGRTGARVAHLASCFGMSVLAHDPALAATGVAVAGAQLVALPDLLAAADVVSLHAPAGDGNDHLVDQGFLASMKPGALFVNVARGSLIDERALDAALRSGRLGGAALDVRASEPPSPSPLDSAPNLILTPHVAGLTGASQRRIAESLVADIVSVLSGGAATCAVGSQLRSRCPA